MVKVPFMMLRSIVLLGLNLPVVRKLITGISKVLILINRNSSLSKTNQNSRSTFNANSNLLMTYFCEA